MGIKPNRGAQGTLQELDYFYNSLFFETVTAEFGIVTCLSGTMIFARLDAILDIPSNYFEPRDRYMLGHLHEYWTHVFGDDRLMTQLLTEQTLRPGVVSLAQHVISDTEPALFPDALLSQRRRWMLCVASTEARAVSSKLFWKHFPFVSCYRIAYQSLRVGELGMVLIAMALIWTRDALGFTVVLIVSGTLLIDWLIFLVFTASHGRSSGWGFPVYILVSPLVNLGIRLHSLLFLRSRSWGGSRWK